jgi:hypothetical protein
MFGDITYCGVNVSSSVEQQLDDLRLVIHDGLEQGVDRTVLIIGVPVDICATVKERCDLQSTQYRQKNKNYQKNMAPRKMCST